MEQNNERRDWGSVRFRRHREGDAHAHIADDAQSRFVTGLVVFLLVVLAYPWYSYWVHSRLLANEFEAGMREIGAEIETAEKQVRASVAQRQRVSAQVDQVRRESTASERIAAVRVMGATDGRNGPVVVVKFGNAGLTEATETVCQQAALFLGRPVANEVLRVQRYRGNQPATDAGHIRC